MNITTLPEGHSRHYHYVLLFCLMPSLVSKDSEGNKQDIKQSEASTCRGMALG